MELIISNIISLFAGGTIGFFANMYFFRLGQADVARRDRAEILRRALESFHRIRAQRGNLLTHEAEWMLLREDLPRAEARELLSLAEEWGETEEDERFPLGEAFVAASNSVISDLLARKRRVRPIQEYVRAARQAANANTIDLRQMFQLDI